LIVNQAAWRVVENQSLNNSLTSIQEIPLRMLTTHTHAAGGVCSSHLFSRYVAILLLWTTRRCSAPHSAGQSKIKRAKIRRVLSVWILALGLLILVPARNRAQTFSDPGFTSDTVVTLPPYSSVGLAFAPDGRMFIWQKNGVVRIFKNGALLTTPFINISSQVNTVTDRGLLGLALDPNFSSNGYVYLLHTYENAGNPNDISPKTARLTRVTADPANPDLALQGSEVVLLGSIGNGPCSNYADGADCIGSDSDSHTIGTLRFAPDGKLFVGSGDGSAYSHADPLALRAQNLNSLNGKILRINTDGTAPGDNPFYDGNPNSNRSKVYAYGLRNPYRFDLHPVTGEPYIGEVGWNAWEELDSGRGANFGWPCYEGPEPQPDYQSQFTQCQQLAQSATAAPLFSYGTATGRTIIGGNFYTATQYPTEYRNNYFFADYTGGWIRRAIFDVNNNISGIQVFATNIGSPVCLELGPDGSLYYISLPTGEVRRIRYTSAPTASASADVTSGYSPLAVSFSSAGSSDPNNSTLSYLWEFGDGTTTTSPNPTKTYTASGVKTFTAKLTVTNAQNVGSSVTLTIVVGSLPPTATINTPADGASFPAGTVVNYQGTATDPDETLPTGAMSWSVLLHHDTHVHPHLTSTGSGGSFVVESHGAGSYYYEITLTVTDSSGLKNTRRVNVNITPSTSWPSPWVTQDIGNVGVAGSASYSNDTFTVKGSGADIWGTDDSFRYVYRPLSGNNEIIARVVDVQNTDPWAKAGLMIRETLAPDSPHASIYLTPGNGVAFQRRTSTGGTSTHTPGSSATAPRWVRLSRSGNTFKAYESADGLSWTLVGTDVINMASSVYIGLAVLSHDNSALCTSTLEVTYNDVPPAITSAPPPAFVNINASYNHTFTATGSPIPTFSVTAGSLPPGLTLSPSGLLTGAPTTPGTYNLTVAASNGAGLAATQSFSIKVNGPPAALNDSYATSQNTALNVSAPGVLGNDNDPNGDAFTAVLLSSPAHGTVSLNAQGSFVYTPAANFSGTDSFTYKATDGQLDSGSVTVTINVNAGGTLAFSASAYTAGEQDGTAQITVTRTGGSAGAATVNYSTGNVTAVAGSDYTASSGTLSFAAGETSKSFNITILNDSLNEPDETLTLTLSNVTGSATLGTPSSSVLTIIDNDPVPTLSTANVSINEGNSGTSDAVFTVSLSAASARSVTVNFHTVDGTANSNDYVPTSGTLTFAPGETIKTVSVSINGDETAEADETFTLSLSNPTNAILSSAIGTGTILNDDTAGFLQFNAATYSFNEAAGTATIQLTRTGGSSGAVAVSYTTNNGTATAGQDYTASAGTLTFASGETSKSFTVALIDDHLFEGDETFSIALSNITGGASPGTHATALVTIVENDPPPPSLQLNQSSYNLTEGSGSIEINVTRTGDKNIPVTVNYTTSDAAAFLQNCNVTNGAATSRCDYVGVLGTLHFAAGETSKTISIPIVDDTYLEGAESFSISLSNPSGGAVIGTNQRATITITDNSNDVSGIANPIDDKDFFVRQHYIDFLSREPDPLSAGWVAMLNQCGAGDQSCRLTVSQGIYNSPEFKDRGYFIYKFYSVSLGRKPSYEEFNSDRARVSGFQTEAELEQSKVDFIADFMARAEFANIYNGLSNNAYVQQLFTTAGVTQITVGGVVRTLSAEQQLLAGGRSRAQVLRDIAESPEVSARFLTESTVVMHYFGYLRRDPDAAYQGWITILTNTGDSRNVTSGFINSPEYRARFGQ
jgi:VCBS repeat-containing protein